MYYELLLGLFLLGPLFYLRVLKNKSWKETKKELLPSYQGHKKEIVGSLALFGALLIGFILIATAIVFLESGTGLIINDMEKVSEVIVEGVSANFIGFIFLLIIVLFAEEFFFRAFLVSRIGMIGSTLIFTFFHLGYGSISEIIGVFFLGLILAYWYKKKKSLLQNYLGHLIYDLFAIAIYLML